MVQEPVNRQQVFLSTLIVAPGEQRVALTVFFISAILFIVAAPYAKQPLAQIFAFIPIYESALIVCDLITAVLLLGQFYFLRSCSLLLLASGYLFTAFIAIAHMLTFPGLFAPTGWLGAGPQSTAWLYMFWHAGFPLFVISYALLKEPGEKLNKFFQQASPTVIGLSSITLVTLLVVGIVTLTTKGQALLPSIMEGNHYTSVMLLVVSAVWALSIVGLIVLWRHGPHTVVDLWLMVVMCAWFFDVALSAVLNAGRFDLGFYAGRIYGLLAASFVLIVLLIENAMLYARLAKAYENEQQERELVQQKTIELTIANKDLDAFTYSVSHDLRAPLRAVSGFTNILEEDYSRHLDPEGVRLLKIVIKNVRRMEQLIDALLAFAHLGRQQIKTQEISLTSLVEQLSEELKASYTDRNIQFNIQDLGMVKVDPVLFKQVLTNLLSNAIKFTRERNPAVIEVGCQQDPEKDCLHYYVKDNGVGFSMDYAAKLFGVFQRLHSFEEYQGSGVGLSIVKRIIERHGGQVWVNAKLNEGATFYFTLAEKA